MFTVKLHSCLESRVLFLHNNKNKNNNKVNDSTRYISWLCCCSSWCLVLLLSLFGHADYVKLNVHMIQSEFFIGSMVKPN